MKDPIKEFGFRPENYRLLFIGLGINVLGFLLMIGGGAENPNEFDGDALFSHIRITIAPILIAAGYGVIIYSIMKKPAISSTLQDNESLIADTKEEINTNQFRSNRKKKGKR